MPISQKLLHTLVSVLFAVALAWFMKEDNVRKWLEWQNPSEFIVQMNLALGRIFGPLGITGAFVYIIVIWVNNG